MTVTLINPFVVPKDQEAVFMERWREVADRLSRAPGFVATHMYRNTGALDQTFLYINVATWESEDTYKAAFKDFEPSTRRISDEIRSHPGLFRLEVEVGRFAGPE